MPTYFEVKRLKNGYEWRDMFENQRGYSYATDVLRIPPLCIDMVTCDPDRPALGILIREEAHLDCEEWFYRLVQTHSYIRTEPDLITFY